MDIADALIKALVDCGVKNVYGVPGDYVLSLFKRFEQSAKVNLICTAGEEGAAFAADAEARLNGLGICMVTHGVGALKILNAIGGAYAEYSPVLVICGTPGVKEGGNEDQRLIHHNVYKQEEDSFQKRMFQEVCVETGTLDSARTTIESIRKVLSSMKAASRPGYLQVPRDRLTRILPWPMPNLKFEMAKTLPSEIEVVTDIHREAGLALLEWMRSKERPTVLAGLQIHRFGLQGAFYSLLEREGWMCATSLTGKTLISERHPLSLGIYNGDMSQKSVLEEIQSSDGVLMIGFPLEDLDTGMFTTHIKSENLARVDMTTGLRWEHGDKEKDELLLPGILLKVWSEAGPPTRRAHGRPSLSPVRPCTPFVPKGGTDITIRRLIEAIGNIVDENSVVLAEVGDALFSAADLHMPLENQFITSGFWASLGFALPAAIGAYFGNTENRPLVLIGDGAFVMSAIEMATLARYAIPAMVIIFDNKGYGTERPMLDGTFNDVHPVDHVMLGTAYGFKMARRATTEAEVWDGLKDLSAVEDGPTVLSVSLDPNDRSDALKNLTGALAKRVK